MIHFTLPENGGYFCKLVSHHLKFKEAPTTHVEFVFGSFVEKATIMESLQEHKNKNVFVG